MKTVNEVFVEMEVANLQRKTQDNAFLESLSKNELKQEYIKRIHQWDFDCEFENADRYLNTLTIKQLEKIYKYVN